ncbi:hypothetical protein IW261DRAFT_1508755 [Armillaria novae-zelandiae]|uniref:Uncharacterized protein n=1 Tax=Armillaria novae-zelandiae TaxID=153914 RepID=A0AA39NUZ7_9AGAR|nr:hypothetical protein IW261DRAFT_1508755 [Armillaria novae-zelandiae]
MTLRGRLGTDSPPSELRYTRFSHAFATSLLLSFSTNSHQFFSTSFINSECTSFITRRVDKKRPSLAGISIGFGRPFTRITAPLTLGVQICCFQSSQSCSLGSAVSRISTRAGFPCSNLVGIFAGEVNGSSGPGLQYSSRRGGSNGSRVIREDGLASYCLDPSDMELVVEKDVFFIVIVLVFLILTFSSSSSATNHIYILRSVVCRVFRIVWRRFEISGGLLLLALDPGCDPLACDRVGAFAFRR